MLLHVSQLFLTELFFVSQSWWVNPAFFHYFIITISELARSVYALVLFYAL